MSDSPQTKTPRTDSFKFDHTWAQESVVPSWFSRQIETELTAASQRVLELERERDEAYERAAKVCEQMQDEKDSKYPAGTWTTLGSTEISGRTFARAIRALSPTASAKEEGNG